MARARQSDFGPGPLPRPSRAITLTVLICLTVLIWSGDFLESLTIDHKPYHASNQQQYACQDQPVR